MRVKRFVGDNVAETMGRIKRELGSEAIILQTRQFREGGFFGLFGRTRVEITAAVEDQPVAVKKMPEEAPLHKAAERAEEKEREREKEKEKEIEKEIGIKMKEAKELRKLQEAEVERERDTAVLKQELDQMRQLMEKMNQNILNFSGDQMAWSPPLQPWADYLRERGIQEPLIRQLLRQVQQDVTEEDWWSRSAVYFSLKNSITKMCVNTTPIRLEQDKPCVVALIGPTGVGKTTTIGKLAAGFSIVDKRKVALITADTYRVAAVEQLKTFGDIIGVAVEVVMAPAGIAEALAKHKDKELIFIDTAGRSPQHDLHMSELRALIDKAKPDVSMLVLSATMNTQDMLQVIQRFQLLADHLIISKLDETQCAGNMLNLIEQTSMPIAYVTNGQNVPDDIEVATPERLALYALGGGLSA
ncbi:MAG: flagellar biosynthesis protein FlhF [Peptococcaceae bacterium]|nr:flagellar biosynthesis protein FlhF [Peptococcaceae bacterium]